MRRIRHDDRSSLALAALALAVPHRRRRCASASPKTRTCSTRRWRAPSSAASSSPALCDKLVRHRREAERSCRSSRPRYEWSADNKSLTIKLRHGVTFHDGEKFDAARGQVQHRAPQDHAGLEPHAASCAGVERRRGRPSTVRLNLVRAVRAAARGADRPRRHDGVAEGGAGRGRQVRRQAGVLGPVQVRRAHRAGPHRARALPELLEQGRRSTSTSIIYQPIPDATVRLANLRSGQLDFIERVAPSDVAAAEERQPLQASPRSPRSATRASRSTSARATWRRRTRSARTRACARHSSSRSTATASCRWRWTARPTVGQPVGRAEQPLLREERADAQARRRRARRRC